MINAYRIFLRTFWVVIHYPYSPIVLWNHTIYDIWCKEKKLTHLVNRPMVLPCMTVNYQHKTQHTHNEAPRLPVEEKRHFYASTLLNKTDVLIVKITFNFKDWPLKLCMIKFCLFYFWMNKFDEMLFELYQKVSDRILLFFWLSVFGIVK